MAQKFSQFYPLLLSMIKCCPFNLTQTLIPEFSLFLFLGQFFSSCALSNSTTLTNVVLISFLQYLLLHVRVHLGPHLTQVITGRSFIKCFIPVNIVPASSNSFSSISHIVFLLKYQRNFKWPLNTKCFFVFYTICLR